MKQEITIYNAGYCFFRQKSCGACNVEKSCFSECACQAGFLCVDVNKSVVEKIR